jgi:hypothetical protein
MTLSGTGSVYVNITSEDKQTEVCAELIPEKENEAFLKSYIKCDFLSITIRTCGGIKNVYCG